jgi:DNA repair protein RecO (recombination protein O)
MTTPRSYRVEGITLKETPFSERDRLLILYTAQRGKLRVLAKGVRRTTSRLSAQVSVFARSNLFLVHGRSIDLVTQGQIIERYALLQTDLWRLSQAFYCGELVDRFTEEDVPNPALYEALCLVLQRLANPLLDPAACVRAFEIDVLSATGYRPQLFRCVACQAVIEPQTNGFSYADGGVLCPACAARSTTSIPISLEALRILRNLQTRAPEIIGRVHVSQETLEQAEHILIGYIQYLLDMRIRSVGFVDVLRRLRSAPEGSVALG